RIQSSEADRYIVKSFSSPHCKSFGQHPRQTGFDSFFLRGRQIVFYPHELDDIVLDIINAVGGTPISVAWLPDAANVDEILLGRFDTNMVNDLASDALVANKNHRHMSVAKEANCRALISETRGRIEIIENVTPLRGCIERCVHDGKIAHLF